MAFYGVIEPVFAAAFSAAIFAAVVGKEICHFPMFAQRPLSFDFYAADIVNAPLDGIPDMTQGVEKEGNLPFSGGYGKDADGKNPP